MNKECVMNNATRRFSTTFLLVAPLLSAAVVLGLRPSSTTQLVLLAAAVIVLGLPHGALDPLVAQCVFRGTSRVFFYASYLIASALVILAWIAWPKLALGCFLLIAAFHFGSDLADEGRVWIRTFYGLTVLAVPCVLHGADVAAIYEQLAGQSTGDYVAFSKWIAYVAGATIFGDALLKMKSQPRRAAEVVAILLSGILLPPLLYFCCYFGLLHSPRHLIETASSLGLKTLRTALALIAAIVAATLCLATIGWGMLSRVSVPHRMLLVVFVGLAALTVPHMLLEGCVWRWRSRTVLPGPPFSEPHSTS